MAESIIFLILLGVRVDPVLLFGCAIAVLLGGLTGAPLVARARVWIVQLVVAIGLSSRQSPTRRPTFTCSPVEARAAGLPLTLTIIAIAANFGFGVLLNFGVGNYAPTLVTLSLMGMDPRLIFPIMAAGAAVMGAGACVRHIQMGQMDLKVVVGLAIGGVPAVLVAAFLVSKAIPIEMLRWLVFVVVVYAAAVMFRAAFLNRRDGKQRRAKRCLCSRPAGSGPRPFLRLLHDVSSRSSASTFFVNSGRKLTWWRAPR